MLEDILKLVVPEAGDLDAMPLCVFVEKIKDEWMHVPTKPLPPALSGGCGLCLAVQPPKVSLVRGALLKEEILSCLRSLGVVPPPGKILKVNLVDLLIGHVIPDVDEAIGLVW